MNTTDQHTDRFEIVTICGSMAFYPFMLKAAQEMTRDGVIVLMPHDASLTGLPEKTATEAGQMLDRMHLAKIRMSGSVYVMNLGGYIGESTRAEIEYATTLGIPVTYAGPVARTVVFPDTASTPATGQQLAAELLAQGATLTYGYDPGEEGRCNEDGDVVSEPYDPFFYLDATGPDGSHLAGGCSLTSPGDALAALTRPRRAPVPDHAPAGPLDVAPF
jgi:hypothetical protein